MRFLDSDHLKSVLLLRKTWYVFSPHYVYTSTDHLNYLFKLFRNARGKSYQKMKSKRQKRPHWNC